MLKLGMVFQPRIPAAVELCQFVAAELEADGHRVWQASAWSGDEMAVLLDDTDVVMTFGGDGTVLRAVRLCGPAGVPVLAVNFGKVGFITEVEPADYRAKINAFLAGEYWIERRSMLEAVILPADASSPKTAAFAGRPFTAVNDVVVSRGAAARVIGLRTSVDGQPYTTFTADGAIVSTPTGSTAYSLAAGGPILDPSLNTILLTPIAPHLGLRQSLVLPADSRVRFEVQSDHGAVVSVDGQHDVHVESGDVIEVANAVGQALLVRFQPRTAFYRTLAERLTRRLLTRDQ